MQTIHPPPDAYCTKKGQVLSQSGIFNLIGATQFPALSAQIFIQFYWKKWKCCLEGNGFLQCTLLKNYLVDLATFIKTGYKSMSFQILINPLLNVTITVLGHFKWSLAVQVGSSWPEKARSDFHR